MSKTTAQTLIDERDIREVLTRYCRATDRCDLDLLKSAYWPDATDNHVVFVGNAMDYAEYSTPMLKQYTKATMHTIANCWIQLDRDVAVAETYVNAWHLMKEPENAEVVVGGRYLDRFEKRNGEWRIAERNVIIDWEHNGGGMMSPEAVKDVYADKRHGDEKSYRMFRNKTLKPN